MATINDIFNSVGTTGLTSKDVITGVKKQIYSETVDIEVLGDPFRFMDMVDPASRAYLFLKSRMSVIDLYPCEYGLGFFSGKQEGSPENQIDFSQFKPTIDHASAMETYSKMCSLYQIPARSGLRLYLTDETTVTDQIVSSYKDNFFQQFFNKLSDVGQSVSSISRSMHSQKYDKEVNAAVDKSAQYIDEGIGKLLNKVGASEGIKDKMGQTIDFLSTGAKFVLKGNRLSLPKIWDNSDYRPTFSAVTKLYSPYGHPKAIKEFIIKPLMYLMLMALPRTQDGVSFGRPFACSIRSYGLTNISVGSIIGMTIRRGGQDTAFNVFRQPLVVEVSLEFESLVNGIAAFEQQSVNDKIPQSEINPFLESDSLDTGRNLSSEEIPGLMPTLGSMVKALSPVNLEGTAINVQGSVRDLYMIGGQGSLGSTAAGVLGGILSEFNSAYTSATETANDQTSFGSLFSSGITNAVANGINSYSRGASLSSSLGAASGSLTSTIGSGYFSGSTLQTMASGIGLSANILTNKFGGANAKTVSFGNSMINQINRDGSILNTRVN